MNTIFSDHPTKKDILDRKKFAKDIAYNLVNSFGYDTESIVFGLNGKWGSGKTTLLGFIKEEIITEFKKHEDENYVLFDFNPWMFSGQEELQTFFLNELAKKFGDKTESIKDYINKLNFIVSNLKWIKYINSGAGEAIKDIENLFQKFTNDESAEAIKKKVDKLIVASKAKIFIFIDDIDRLTPKEITEIFQLVKLNARFKNTYYLIAFDKDVVETALNGQFNIDGKKYLEKIIQVDYTIPEILSEKIENIFFEQLNIFFSNHHILYTTDNLLRPWYYEGLKEYFKTLRHIYRYMNALEFRLPKIYEEINITDFLLVEAIRIFDYDAYKKLYYTYTEFIEKYAKFYGPVMMENDIKCTENLNTQKIIAFLMTKRQYKQIDNIIEYEKMFSDPAYFERYYSFRISNNDISEKEFNKFINIKHSRESQLEVIYKNGRLKNFIRRFKDPNINLIYPQIADSNLFRVFLNFADKHNEILPDFWLNIWEVLKNIAKCFADYHKGIEQLLNALMLKTNEFSASRFLYISITIENIDIGFEHEFVEVKDILLQYKEDLNKRYKEILHNWDTIFLSNPAEYYIDLIRNIFIKAYAKHYPNEYIKKLDKILAKPKDLMVIVKMILIIDGDKKLRRINPKEIDIVLPGKYYQQFAKKIKRFNMSMINKEEQEYIKFLREFFDELKESKKQ